LQAGNANAAKAMIGMRWPRRGNDKGMVEGLRVAKKNHADPSRTGSRAGFPLTFPGKSHLSENNHP
jgi:hypothetical protein